MHMYINFNTLLEAGSLMISFFLMEEEGEYEACRSTRRLDIDLF